MPSFFVACQKTSPMIKITGPHIVMRNSDAIFTCTASFGTDLSLVPYWYINGHGSKKLCGTPQFSIQKPQYHSETCIWTSSLVVANFDDEQGILYCGSDYMWANHTLKMEGETNILV